MFARYTKTARRVIFSARDFATAAGSPCIDTDHLLIGLLQEDPGLLTRCISTAGAEEFRLKVGALASKEAREDPAQADLPLSPDSKYVLMYAGNEAKERGDPYIGSEHLLLGLLLQESGLAEIALGELGVTIAEVRKRLEDPPQHPEMT